MGLRERVRSRARTAGKALIERIIGEANEAGIGESHGARTSAWPPSRMGSDGSAKPPVHPVDLAEAGSFVEAHADFEVPMEIAPELIPEPPPEPVRVDPEVASAMLLDSATRAPTGSVAQGEWLPMPTPAAASPEPETQAAEPEDEPAAKGPAISLSQDERTSLEGQIVEVLKTVYDPEIPVDIYELGLIYGVEVAESGAAEIKMTLTSPNCPAAQSMPAEVETKTKRLDGVSDAMVDIVWDPPWGPEMMSEAARLELNIM